MLERAPVEARDDPLAQPRPPWSSYDCGRARLPGLQAGIRGQTAEAADRREDISVIPEHMARRLTGLHELRAKVDREIRNVEAELRAGQRRKTGARQRRRQWIEHGTNAGYQWHLRHAVPFPEDAGERDCGCREVHAAYVAAANRYRMAARRIEQLEAS